MAEPRPLTNDEGEVRELTAKDFAQFIPFSALPADLQKLLTSSKQIVELPTAEQPAA